MESGWRTARALIVAAHPDDEMIGLGTHLAQMELAAIVHVTDGAPRNGKDARKAGCSSWQAYAALRREEFEQALAASGAHSGMNVCLRIPDQQASFRMTGLAKDFARLLERLRPGVIFTHSYEGGHPDHDATALVVHAEARKAHVPIMEFAGYHAGPDGFECERFLQSAPAHPLTAVERDRKRRILACFASQHHVIQQFPLEYEPIRPAPDYDFLQPPHAGTLWYEQLDWGITGAQWRGLARQALRDLSPAPTAAGSAE